MRKTPGSKQPPKLWEHCLRPLGLMVPFTLWGVLGLLLVLVVTQAASAEDSGQAGFPVPGWDGVRIVESSGTRIVLEITPADYAATRQFVGDRAYDLLSIAGWSLTQQAGMPQVPTRRVLIGVPPEAELHLAVLDATVRDGGPYHILPAPERLLPDDLSDLDQPWLDSPQLETRYAESPSGYETSAYQPTAAAQLGAVAWLRSQRVAAVDLYPLLYSAGSGQVRFHSRFRVELSFSYASGHQAGGFAGEEAAFEQLLESELLNYEQAREWRSSASLSPALVASADWPLPSDAYKIVVTESGLYQLTYDFLLQGGMSEETISALNPQTIQLFSMGHEVGIQVIGEEDLSFDPGDYVLFYGQALENKYTNENVYWLTYGQAVGRRMERRSGEPSGAVPSPSAFMATLLIEEERAYMSQWPGDDSTDRWYWQYMIAEPGEPASLTVEVSLGSVSSETLSSTLWVSMLGWTLADHKAEFFVNDQSVGEYSWFGNDTVERIRIDFPQAYLNAGSNTFSAYFPGADSTSWDSVFFDRYELRYGRAYQADSDYLEFSQVVTGTWEYEVAGFSQGAIGVFDVSEPLALTQIVSPVVEASGPAYTIRFSDTVPATRTYLALTPDRWLEPVSASRSIPRNLRSPANAADYIIISHAGFLQAAHHLADYRASQGLRTLVVDVQDVYDEFGFGLATPNAIRDFVRFAYQNWQSTYLVLLGDGTYDPKNNLNQGAVSYLTPYLGYVEPWFGYLGETATDNWFVSVSGEDILPDLHLGRLPANSPSEAQTMVGKIIVYEQAQAGANWARHLTFVAGLPDPGAGDFHALSEAVIDDSVPAGFEITRVYLGAVPGSTCATGEDCGARLIESIDAGTLLVNFIGHGSKVQWESIFDRSMIPQLSNSDVFPVMLPMTCLDGYFIEARRPDSTYPDYPSLSELLVRTPGKGAVASWGPTGLGVASGHDQLDRGFLQALLLDGTRELGPAAYAGKLRLYNAGYSLEQIEEYTIFGDPALRIKAPAADLGVSKHVEAPEQVLPGDIVTFTLSFTNVGPGIAFDVTLADLLPPELVNATVVYSTSEVISQHIGTTFSWAIIDLWPHSGGEIRVRAEVGPGEKPPSFFNTAIISSSTPDLNLANNRSKVGVGTKRAWLPLILKSR